MSSPRAQQLFQMMPEHIKKLGAYTFDVFDVIKFQGIVGTNDLGLQGYSVALIDIDATTWADNNKRAIIVAIPAQDKNATAALKTQSHASGFFIDGPYNFKVYMETPEDHTGAQVKFQRILMHHLVGQLASPAELLLCANDTEPTLQGVNGVVAASPSYTSAGIYLPYGMAYPGGV